MKLNSLPDLNNLDNQICVQCPLCGNIEIKSLKDMKVDPTSDFGKKIKYAIYICFNCHDDENNITSFTVDEFRDDNNVVYFSDTCTMLCYDKYMNLISTGECTYVS